MTEEQQATLRHLHNVLPIGKFRELDESGQIALLKEVEELLFSQSTPMTDRRRLGNLIAPISFANVPEGVASIARELTERWDKAPF